MADPQAAVAAQPVNQPAQPTPEFKVPDGKVLFDAAEAETLRRNNERLRGVEKFYQSATKVGFKKPEDFGQYEKFQGVLNKRGFKLEELSALLEGQIEEPTTPETPAGGGGFDPAMLKKYLKDANVMTREDFENETKKLTARQKAEQEYESLTKAEQDLVEKMLDGTPGFEKASEFEKRALRAMWSQHVSSLPERPTYEPDHPLATERWRPFDEKTLPTAFEKFKASVTELRGKGVRQNAAKAPAASPSGPMARGAVKEEDGADKSPQDKIRDAVAQHISDD
jgi:hypothetical protein